MNSIEKIASTVAVRFAASQYSKPYYFVMTCRGKKYDGKWVETDVKGFSFVHESLADCVADAKSTIGALPDAEVSVGDSRISITTDEGVYDWKVVMRLYDFKDGMMSDGFIKNELKMDGIVVP